jgi:hypothetical protein
MSSVRQKVVSAVIARMLLINGTGSYSRNVGTNVEDSRTNWSEEDLATHDAISIFDGDAGVENPQVFDKTTVVIQTMRLLIKGFVKQGTTAAAARTLISDIWTAVRQDPDWKVGGTATVMQTRHVRDAISRNPDSYEVEACEVEIELQFGTQKFSSD